MTHVQSNLVVLGRGLITFHWTGLLAKRQSTILQRTDKDMSAQVCGEAGPVDLQAL